MGSTTRQPVTGSPTQQSMAHGFAGCAASVLGAFLGGVTGYFVALSRMGPAPDAPASDWLLHGLHLLVTVPTILACVAIGGVVGAVAGFVIGVTMNVRVVRRRSEAKTAESWDADP